MTGFNTCSSCEEQLAGIQSLTALPLFQYMLPLRGATKATVSAVTLSAVSIHAPLARSNSAAARDTSPHSRFNTCSSCEEQPAGVRRARDGASVSIHAPLARSNVIAALVSAKDWFQYMLLLRGATCLSSLNKASLCFNTCSSCEEQPEAFAACFSIICFNTCSSCEEQRIPRRFAFE